MAFGTSLRQKNAFHDFSSYEQCIFQLPVQHWSWLLVESKHGIGIERVTADCELLSSFNYVSMQQATSRTGSFPLHFFHTPPFGCLQRSLSHPDKALHREHRDGNLRCNLQSFVHSTGSSGETKNADGSRIGRHMPVCDGAARKLVRNDWILAIYYFPATTTVCRSPVTGRVFRSIPTVCSILSVWLPAEEEEFCCTRSCLLIESKTTPISEDRV